MYHERFTGTHNEIGFHWGALLAERGNYILDHIGFPITAERLAFSERCLPAYQEHFPDILQEIRGIAEGQKCDEKKLRAFLFSMYAMPPYTHCSCFAVANGRSILLGRNSDFLTRLEKSNMNALYRFTAPSYSFTGNTTAFVQMEDGVNEHGLAIGLTSVYPALIRPGMNAGLLLRFFLEKCKNAEEVIEQLHTLPISSAQTFTIADAAGNVAVAECCAQKVVIRRPSGQKPYVCAANIFRTEEMAQFNIAEIDNWQADERYGTLVEALDRNANTMDFGFASDLLSGKHGFLCQYDRKTGKDTVWSVLYDLTHGRIYRAEGNPSRCRFREDTRFHMTK